MLYSFSVNCSLNAVNKSLESGSPSDTLEALKALGSHIPTVLDFAAPLYHEEMAAIREDAEVRCRTFNEVAYLLQL